ncbi:MAG: respiratory nitrate reductase subunit gamma [Propionibacteriaceae bacterium]|jgi:nitrate reductase gamma subunit|nr:respiratory nitrate reductase subunit gamma [Propionibacteriaceae bacterium]
MKLHIALFGVLPYLALASFVIGHIWRWRYDQFGWTTRTSQLMEKRWLMWGSPIFHAGLLLLILGHATGLLIPASLTTWLGISEETYHVIALVGGLLAGSLVAIGLTLLLLRRFVTKARLRIVTRSADLVMYVLLALTASAGMIATIGVNMLGGGYNYRETISVWLRSLFVANPNIELMASAPWLYQTHAVLALALIAIWPYTRLVHLWSIPLGYLVRPPIVYHSPVRK